VPGQQQGHDLVAQQHRVHGAAVVVAGAEQRRQQVVGIRPAGAALGDEAVDGVVDRRPGGAEAADARRRDAQPQRAERVRDEPVEVLEQGGQAGAHAVGLGGLQAGPEEGAHDDAQRQPGHLDVHVELLPVAPARRRLLGELPHRVVVAGHAPAAEGGRGEAGVPAVQLALAGQQALAQHGPGALQHEALLVAPRVVDQHLADELGIVDAEVADGAEPQRRQPAVALPQAGEPDERVALHRAHLTQTEPAWPGRAARGAVAGHAADDTAPRAAARGRRPQ
jgi:hypothetical protein